MVKKNTYEITRFFYLNIKFEVYNENMQHLPGVEIVKLNAYHPPKIIILIRGMG